MNDIQLIRVFGKLTLDMREFVALLPNGQLLLRCSPKSSPQDRRNANLETLP